MASSGAQASSPDARDGSQGWLERFAEPPGSGYASSLLAFRALLLVHAAVRVWDRYLVEGREPLHLLMALVLSAAALASAFRRFDRPAILAAAWTVGVEVAITHGIANHEYLELLVLVLFACLDPSREEDAELLLPTLRWTVTLLFLWTGLQKLLHGAYFQGEFLCWMIARRPSFALALGFLMPAEEVARLAEAGALAVGSGPYRTSDPMLLLASNAVWLAELAGPVLLLVPRTRMLGMALSALFGGGIQLVARELMFGLLFTQLMLLILPGRGFLRIAPFYALAYAYLVGYLAGWLPAAWVLKQPGGL